MSTPRKTLFTILLFCFTLPLWGQSAGTTVFEFLKTQYSARGAAMANNMVAIRGDINAMFYNPAVLSGLTEGQWTANYVDHLLDLQAGQILYGRKSGKFGTLGIGLLYFNYGSFDETDEFGEATGRDFGATEMALGASVSNELGEGFEYGFNAKLIYSSLDDYSSSGLAFDGGIIYSPDFINDFHFGVSVTNLGFILSSYTDAKQKMPLFVRLGFSKKLEHLPLLFTASLNDLTLNTGETADIIKRFSLGGEFDISKVIRFRLGYDNGINQSVKPLSGRSFGGVSAGLGILWKKFRIDYAYSEFGDLGAQNRFGITGRF